MTLSKLGGDKMNKRMKLLLVTLSLVVIMAVPVFANQGVLRNHRFLREQADKQILK